MSAPGPDVKAPGTASRPDKFFIQNHAKGRGAASDEKNA